MSLFNALKRRRFLRVSDVKLLQHLHTQPTTP